MDTTRGLEDFAYILPNTYFVHGNRVKMYCMFYSYDDQCYYSLTMTSQGRKAPKKKDSWMYLQHPDPDNRKWYLFSYKPLQLAAQDEDPVGYIHSVWLPKKFEADRRKDKIKWVPWQPTENERIFLVAHMHRWQAEHAITDYKTKCHAKPPHRDLNCEAKHGGSEWACVDDYRRNGAKCNPMDADCLPACYYDDLRKMCQDLPNDPEMRRRVKGMSERDKRQKELDALPRYARVEPVAAEPPLRVEPVLPRQLSKPVVEVPEPVVLPRQMSVPRPTEPEAPPRTVEPLVKLDPALADLPPREHTMGLQSHDDMMAFLASLGV